MPWQLLKSNPYFHPKPTPQSPKLSLFSPRFTLTLCRWTLYILTPKCSSLYVQMSGRGNTEASNFSHGTKNTPFSRISNVWMWTRLPCIFLVWKFEVNWTTFARLVDMWIGPLIGATKKKSFHNHFGQTTIVWYIHTYMVKSEREKEREEEKKVCF